MSRFKSIIPMILVLGLVAGLIFQAGCGEDVNKLKVTGSTVLTLENPQWTLSTPDADKNKHAHFIAEYGWVDDGRATDASAPDPVDAYAGFNTLIEFHTDWGTFFWSPPPREKKSYVENGMTRYKWILEMDIGAKNEQFNPVHYHISGSATGMQSMTLHQDNPDYHDVWIDASISYVPYP